MNRLSFSLSHLFRWSFGPVRRSNDCKHLFLDSEIWSGRTWVFVSLSKLATVSVDIRWHIPEQGSVENTPGSKTRPNTQTNLRTSPGCSAHMDIVWNNTIENLHGNAAQRSSNYRFCVLDFLFPRTHIHRSESGNAAGAKPNDARQLTKAMVHMPCRHENEIRKNPLHAHSKLWMRQAWGFVTVVYKAPAATAGWTKWQLLRQIIKLICRGIECMKVVLKDLGGTHHGPLELSLTQPSLWP
jgi:hypothetical protein